jgi:23S rRNA (uracil1939-C5)-methyltransferase
MNLHIEKIVYPGKSMAIATGKVIFCDEGLPGEEVEAVPIKEKKTYVEARVTKILKESPHRVPARCAHYKTCSPYQCIDYPLQLEIKKSQIQEIFLQSLRIKLPNLMIRPSPEIWGYRNKVRLSLIREGSKAHLAYHQPGAQDEFVRIEKCFLVSAEMNALLCAFREITTAKNLDVIEEVEVKESSSNQAMLLVLCLNSRQDMEGLKENLAPLKSRFPLRGIICLVKKRKGLEEIILDGENYIEERVGENTFRIGPQSFFQVNMELLKELFLDLRNIIPLSGKERVADLYSGVGTFGISLASNAAEVMGVESSTENIEFLKKNLALNRVGNFTVCEGLSEEWISWVLKKRIDLLILDPPRKGISRSIVQSLLDEPVSLIVYLSCNPSTLARDLKLLNSKYKLKDIRIYDFFPHTPHLETCAILEKF